jgi:hypothetical protein
MHRKHLMRTTPRLNPSSDRARCAALGLALLIRP